MGVIEELTTNKLPNFIIAGGVATGTSFLSHALATHSQVYLPKIMRPECSYFYKSWEYEKGIEYYSKKYFDDVRTESAIGERSSLYLHGDFLGVPEKIQLALPNIKLIFCLRNPTERAFANYRFSVLSGYENRSFERALNLEDKRFLKAKGWKTEIQPNLYRRRGNYMSQIEEYLRFFNQNNILFIKSETMNKYPQRTFDEVFRFLGVRKEELVLPTNFSSHSVKSKYLQQVLRKTSRGKFDAMTENIRQGSKLNWSEKIIKMNVSHNIAPMSPKNRNTLNEYYRDQNEKLSKFLSWDLSDWN